MIDDKIIETLLGSFGYIIASLIIIQKWRGCRNMKEDVKDNKKEAWKVHHLVRAALAAGIILGLYQFLWCKMTSTETKLEVIQLSLMYGVIEESYLNITYRDL